jgi:hypothetical protein
VIGNQPTGELHHFDVAPISPCVPCLGSNRPTYNKALRVRRLVPPEAPWTRVNHNLRFALQNIDLILKESISFDDFDFVSEYAPLLQVPDDVKPEWEDAVYEAMRALMISIEHRKAPVVRERNLAHDFPELQKHMRALYRRFFASELSDPLFEPDK